MVKRSISAAALIGVLALSGCASTVSGHGVSALGGGSASSSVGTAGPSGSGSPGSAHGNGALPADQLANEAQAAMFSATSFHMKGNGRDSDGPLGFDLHYGASSTDGSMTITGAMVRLRYAAGQIYMNGSERFWRKVAGADSSADGDAAVALLRDKWVHVPAGTPGLSEIGQLAIRQKFLDQMLSNAKDTTYRKGPAKVVNGVPAVSFVDDSDGSVIYVPAQGRAYPIRIEAHGDDPGTFDLDAWNVPFTAPVPPKNEIIELPH